LPQRPHGTTEGGLPSDVRPFKAWAVIGSRFYDGVRDPRHLGGKCGNRLATAISVIAVPPLHKSPFGEGDAGIGRPPADAVAGLTGFASSPAFRRSRPFGRSSLPRVPQASIFLSIFARSRVGERVGLGGGMAVAARGWRGRAREQRRIWMSVGGNRFRATFERLSR
jgi:hypothetical protein